MFRLIFLFVILGAGLFVGTQFAGQQGYVLISIANKTIEMSVTTLVIFVIAILAALFGLEYLLKKALNASSRTWNWFGVRKLKRSRRYTNEGIIKLMEGDYKQAEKRVTRWSNHHDMPLLCYLVASEAADNQGKIEQRDHYLQLAADQPDSYLVVELTRARQHVRQKQFEKALVTLDELHREYPNNSMVLSLLKTTYVELKRWEALLSLLPRLLKEKCISEQQYEQLMIQAQCGALIDVAEKRDSEGLIEHWDHLPKKLKTHQTLTQCFAQQLIARQADNEAFTVIKETLKKHPGHTDLYDLVAKLNLSDNHPALTFLNDALKKDGQNAEAHSALAQLHMKEKNWPQAQQHLESALKIRSKVTDYALLADALGKQNMTQAANEVSRKALTLVSN